MYKLICNNENVNVTTLYSYSTIILNNTPTIDATPNANVSGGGSSSITIDYSTATLERQISITNGSDIISVHMLRMD